MRFDPAYPVADVRPAPYNPRRIDELEFLALVGSIGDLGLIRPIIVNSDQTILAGHQRSKALKQLGVEHVPAFVADEHLGLQDEMRFNQFHNAADLEDPTTPVTVPPGTGWAEVPGRAISGWQQVGEPTRKITLGKMLIRFGQWSNAIATESGRVLVGTLYATVTASMGLPLLVCYVPDDRAETVLQAFGQEYGVFDYSNVPFTQWTQAANQPNRKVTDDLRPRVKYDDDISMSSTVWTRDVLPFLKPTDRIFELGSGRGAYAEAARRNGYRVVDIEFYRRVVGQVKVDLQAVQHAIDELCHEVATGGPFDVTVLDSVLNSAGTGEGQRHCLTLINALTKPGGYITCSGKSLGGQKAKANMIGKNSVDWDDRHRFFSEQGISANYSRGAWYFQKYHTHEEVLAMHREFIGGDFWLLGGSRKRPVDMPPFALAKERFDTVHLWQLSGYKAVEMDPAAVEAAVRYEFELPYPNGRTVGRSEDVLAAMREGGIL